MNALIFAFLLFADAPATAPASLPASMPATAPPLPPASAPPASPRPAASPSLLPRYGVETYDVSQTPWGPGRKSSGEAFRSAATLLPEGPLRLRGETWSLAFGVQLFARAELRDNNDLRTSAYDLAPLLDHRARVSVRASAFDRVGILLELQDVRGWGTERTTVVTEPFTGLHQGFLDVHAAKWLDLRVGRQELCYGEDRLLGCLDWAQSGRAYDGLFARLSQGMLTVDLFGFYVKSVQRLTRTLPDGTTQPLLNTGSYLYGAYARLRPAFPVGFDLYALAYTDDPTSVDIGQRGSNHTVSIGSRITGKVRGFSATAEGVFQTGRFERVPIAAGGFAVRASYTAPIFGAPYALAEVVGASGDPDPNDGVHRQFNQLFPTGHAHLGYIDYVAWSNVVDTHVALGWKPLGVHLWADYHHFRFWDPRGRWLSATGALFIDADPTRTASVMGDELDVSLTVPLTPNVAISTALGLFFPGPGAQAAPGSTIGRGQSTSTWGFVYVRSQL
ncbi:MAG: alginate export family protein [Deltaproteobacteria bacterium]|nr:alginate export family protein [Deltaproteobacteria bacterium]